MRFLRISVVAISLFSQVFGQSTIEFDTLNPQADFFSSASAIDSLLQNSRSTFSNIGLQDGIFFQPLGLFAPFGTFIHKTRINPRYPSFTALPFVGFNYAFGTQGSQHITLYYAQSFKRGWLLNAHFLSNGSKGFVRNSAWKNRNVALDLAHTGTQWRSLVHAQQSLDYRQFSGGILNDSLLGSFDINLVPVRKDSCSSNALMHQILWKNEFNFLRDSLRFFGLVHQSELQNVTREYLEQDTLFGLYPFVYFDSLSTMDRTELTSIGNSIGMAASIKQWRMELLSNGDFWRYRMRGNQRDTLEVGILAKLSYRSLATKANVQFRANLFGGFNAFEGEAILQHRFKKGFGIKGWASMGRKAPEVIQRFYFGNTLQQSLTSINLQQFGMFRLHANLLFLGLNCNLGINGLIASNLYQYNGFFWDHQTALSMQQLLEFRFDFEKSWKGFTFKPTFNYLMQKIQVLPDMGLGSSIDYQGFLTKSKNLYFFAKLNYVFYRGYRPLALIPQLSVLDFSAVNALTFNYHSVNALVGFRVKTFQFYLASENLGTLLMDQRQPLLVGLPIPVWQLKLGITWVFWN